MRAAAWARQTAAVMKDKATVLTAERLQDESPGLVSCDRFHRVHEMIFNLSLWNAQHLCQLVRRQPKPGLFMNTCYVVRSSRPAGLFSFGLLDGLQVRLRWPYLQEAPARFGLERLATAFMNNPG